MEASVLFLVFNRPDATRLVLDAIRKAAPKRLYVAADGPRSSHPGDQELVRLTREVVLEGVDWNCELFTLFREQNLGCKVAVSSAIKWFFDHEHQGVILEDDCLPHPGFLNFCEELLSRYANDKRIWHIGSNNYQDGIWRGDGDYYFSNNMHIWGWATWRDRWQHYDIQMQGLDQFLAEKRLNQLFTNPANRSMWRRQFKWITDGLDTWDIQWQYAIWKHGGLVVTPNVNLVTNIGFGGNATHTHDATSRLANRVSGALALSRHPTKIMVDQQADAYEFTAYRRKPGLAHRIRYRLGSWLQNLKLVFIPQKR